MQRRLEGGREGGREGGVSRGWVVRCLLGFDFCGCMGDGDATNAGGREGGR